MAKASLFSRMNPTLFALCVLAVLLLFVVGIASAIGVPFIFPWPEANGLSVAMWIFSAWIWSFVIVTVAIKLFMSEKNRDRWAQRVQNFFVGIAPF